MKKIVYKTGVFTDFTGMEREVIFCAISVDEGKDSPIKMLNIGIAVQNPKDARNTELGKTIASGKALKPKSSVGRILTDNKGFINTKVVNALLEQEFEYFRTNPGAYLASYNKDKALYKVDPAAYDLKMGL